VKGENSTKGTGQKRGSTGTSAVRGSGARNKTTVWRMAVPKKWARKSIRPDALTVEANVKAKPKAKSWLWSPVWTTARCKTLARESARSCVKQRWTDRRTDGHG